MAQQRRDLLDADLVVVNGGDLEEGLLDVVAAAASEGAPVVEALDAVAPLHYDNGDLDPHFWHDTDRAARFVRSIAEQMAALKPEQAATFRAAADDYATELERLGTEIDSLLEPVPAAERLLVTNHDAYRYFAERFGFQIVGTIIPGRSTQASPSAAHLAELVSLMLERHIRVVFTEDEGSLAVPEMLAAEVGPDVEVLRLSSGTLPDGYADMLRTNASRIADALACRATTGRSTWNG